MSLPHRPDGSCVIVAAPVREEPLIERLNEPLGERDSSRRQIRDTGVVIAEHSRAGAIVEAAG